MVSLPSILLNYTLSVYGFTWPFNGCCRGHNHRYCHLFLLESTQDGIREVGGSRNNSDTVVDVGTTGQYGRRHQLYHSLQGRAWYDHRVRPIQSHQLTLFLMAKI